MSICGCTYERQYFDITELDEYSAPFVFLREQDTEMGYFVSLADTENKFFLDYKEICDFNVETNTFLFLQEKDGIEIVCEYDLTQKKHKCLVDEKVVQEYLGIVKAEEFSSVYYHPENGKISFCYEEYVVVYDINDGFVSKLELEISQVAKVYGWINAEKFLFVDFPTTYEVNFKSGEKNKINSELGSRLILSADKTMGSSLGDENYFGITFSPIMIWNIQNYKVKKYHEGSLAPARTQFSNDKKYVMFAQCQDTNQILCMDTEDESVCVIYETDDFIMDILWK